MEILTRAAEEEPANASEYGIAEIPMVHGHRPTFDASSKAISHNEIDVVAQSRHKRVEIRKIVTVVGISYDNVTPASGEDAST
jgi:hypothetical protein